MADDKKLNQEKLLRMIKATLIAVERMPDSPQKDAIAGGLEVILEEAEKPLPLRSGAIH